MDEQSQRWTFTSWKEPTNIKATMLLFMLYQSEETKGGRTHYQGYVEFRREYTGKYVKSIFKDKTIHIEPANESREVNMFYCLKPQCTGTRYMYYEGKTHRFKDEPKSPLKLTLDDMDDIFQYP